jgi:hypothetical protein
MFLPSEIGLRINNFSYTGRDGRQRFLVSSVETINTSQGRAEVLDTPRELWPGGLLASLFLSELLVLFYLLWGKRNGFKTLLGITNSLLGFFFGIAGSVLFFMTFFTDHDYTYNNSNVFFVNPLFLAAIPFGLTFAFSSSDKKSTNSRRLLEALWIYIFIGGAITLAINFTPVFYQQDYVTHALLLPLTLTMIFTIARLKRL